MPGYISPKQQEAKDDLIYDLRLLIFNRGGVAKAARKANMEPHDLAAILRLDRAVSLSKLFHIGEANGLKMEMQWVVL